MAAVNTFLFVHALQSGYIPKRCVYEWTPVNVYFRKRRRDKREQNCARAGLFHFVPAFDCMPSNEYCSCECTGRFHENALTSRGCCRFHLQISKLETDAKANCQLTGFGFDQGAQAMAWWDHSYYPDCHSRLRCVTTHVHCRPFSAFTNRFSVYMWTGRTMRKRSSVRYACGAE